ncbi:MAG: 4Fe-4S dicluster domain-containing protein [Proteobacteria bacterium]|nr:4Fe-4S dicluster domain-containing protein [Pseudomonadota bacterium]MBU1060380.1 4Fe-4S dicluster domain-containing protein [Pseudomonadota bacterium]
MKVININSSYNSDFVKQVEEESGQKLNLCYQCGKCTAGCPYTDEYDISVSQIMRLAQAGQKEKVLQANSLWLCATCESCTARCPNEIDVARIMDVLRHMARREGHGGTGRVKTFWDSFLSSVKSNGRVFEVGLLVNYISHTGRFWTDIGLGPKVLPKGKIHFKPTEMQGKKEVAKIFMRFKEESAK